MSIATTDRKVRLTFTVTDASKRFRRTTGRIRQICIKHEIGKLIKGRIRLLSGRDVQKIGRIIEEYGYQLF